MGSVVGARGHAAAGRRAARRRARARGEQLVALHKVRVRVLQHGRVGGAGRERLQLLPEAGRGVEVVVVPVDDGLARAVRHRRVPLRADALSRRALGGEHVVDDEAVVLLAPRREEGDAQRGGRVVDDDDLGDRARELLPLDHAERVLDKLGAAVGRHDDARARHLVDGDRGELEAHEDAEPEHAGQEDQRERRERRARLRRHGLGRGEGRLRPGHGSVDVHGNQYPLWLAAALYVV